MFANGQKRRLAGPAEARVRLLDRGQITRDGAGIGNPAQGLDRGRAIGRSSIAGDGEQTRDGQTKLKWDDRQHGRLADLGFLIAETIDDRLLDVGRRCLLDVQAQERGRPNGGGRRLEERGKVIGRQETRTSEVRQGPGHQFGGDFGS